MVVNTRKNRLRLAETDRRDAIEDTQDTGVEIMKRTGGRAAANASVSRAAT